MKGYFAGNYEELQGIVAEQGIDGIWTTCRDDKHRQFCAASGAILNYWTTTRRIYIEVSRSPEDQALSNLLGPILLPQGNTLQTLLEDDTTPIAPPPAASPSNHLPSKKKRKPFNSHAAGGIEELSLASPSRSQSHAMIEQLKRSLEAVLRDDDGEH